MPDFIPDQPPDTRPLANRPDDTDVSGTLKNLGTSLIKGLPHVPTPANPVFASDLNELTKYLVMRGHSALSGKSMEELQARRDALQKQMGESSVGKALDFIPKMPTAEDVTAPILKRTGEYNPTTPAGRIGSAVVQTGASMGPGKFADVGRRVLMGGLAGGAGETATEYTGDPLAGIVAASVAPVAAGKAADFTAKTVRPYRPSQRQGMADELLLKNTRDPQAAAQKLGDTLGREIAPGSEPSTAEVTMDPGHVIADKLAKARSTEYQQLAKDRETGQNTARRSVVTSLADPKADPVEVSNAFRQYLNDVEADHGKTVSTLEAKAKQQGASITGIEAEEVGKSLRGELRDANARHQQYFEKAYDALDPDKKLNLVASPVSEAAKAIRERPNRDLETTSKLADDALNKAQGLDKVVSFERLRTLDKTLTKLMSQAKREADPGYGDIVQLKGAVKDAFAKAVENQIKYEQQAVARGDMATEETFAHKLAQQVDAYYAGQERAGAVASAGGNGGRPSAGVSSNTGTPRGSGPEAGSEGLPQPNLGPETAKRLADVNKEYGEYRSLYGAEPIAGALKTTGFKDQFKVPDSTVAAKAFPAGDGGYEATSRWLEGAGKSDQALADVKSIAVARLRDMMKGETLTPEALNAWRSKYAPALRAINEASPGFTDNFNTAASTTRALNRAIADQKMAVADAQKGIAAKFLGLTDADDVTALIGNAMNAKNSGQQVGELLGRLKGNDVAIAGARKAAVDWLLNRSSKMGVSGAGENLLSTDRVVNFVRDNPAAIQKMFGDDGLSYLKSVSADMKRSQQLLTAQSTAGSDTASKLLGRMIAEAEQHAQHGTMPVGEALNLVAMGEMFHGEPITALKVKVAQGVIEKAQGLLSHRRGAGIAEVNRMFMEGLDSPEVAKVMLERAMTPDGKVNATAFARLASLLGMTQQAEEGERRHRADGGRVSKIDYAAKASQLLRMAEKAKKAHGNNTKSLLKYPDELISGALRLANQDV